MMKFLSDKLVKTLSLAFLAGLTVTTDAQSFKWSPAGPIYTAGRARNMIVDKADPNGQTLYVGSTTSGIFKSTDLGQNWGPLNDQATVRNISYMAQAADNTIYVGTGEGFLRPSQAAKAQAGTGLYKLVGTNLVQVKDAVTTSTVINRIACHPFDANIIAISTQTGVLYSVDGGSTFITANTGLSSMGQDVKFDISGNLYFSVGPVSVAGGTASSTVWKSVGPLSSSSTFTNITPTSVSLPNPNFGRIEIAISPSNPNVVYVSCANKYNFKNSATLAGLFVSYDATSSSPTWGTVLIGSSQLDPLSNGGTIASGDYAHTILVDPTNSDHILIGGYVFYSFTKTGGSPSSPSGTWQQAGSPYALNSQVYLHENIHDIKIIGSNPIKFYFVTDAGIFRSIDLVGGIFPSFQPYYKGLITGQFNSVSIDRFGASSTSTVAGTTITPNQTYIGGTGGNGMTYFSGNYPNVSQEISYESGDIFNAQYSWILPKAAYFSAGSGSLFRTADVTTGTSNLCDWVVNTKKQDVQSLTNSSYSLAGTPFKMWENLGSPVTPDSLVFYNDTAIARSTIPTLTTSTSFSFSVGRPQSTAIIDYITVRAGTVVVAATPSQVAVNPYVGLNTKTLTIVMNPTYTNNPSSTVALVAPISTVTGYAGALSTFSVVMNPNNLDNIYLTLAGPLFTANPTSAPSLTNVADYLRITATVYYRYPAGSAIKIVDNSISTKSSTLTTTTPTSGVLSWNSTVTVGSSTVPVVNPVLKLATNISARLAMPYASQISPGNYAYSIRVSNAPLDLNTPLSFVNVSQNKCLTDDANGNPTTNTVSVLGKPTLLEWSKSGKNLYYATDAGTVTCLYRVSHLTTLVDSTAKGYNGKLHTNVFTYSTSSTPNPRCPYRTTLLGTFPNKITSISVPSGTAGLVLTFNDPSPTGTLVMVSDSTQNFETSDFNNLTFANRTPTIMANRVTYCSMLEKNNPRKAYIGTDNGIFYTGEITSSAATWSNVNTYDANSNYWLPNVQIFDIKQQTLDKWNCYNSGQIYVATNGRGIWTNSDYYVPTVVSINEIPKTATTENNLTMYPNPTNGNVTVSFNGISGETAKINVYDINGRLIKADDLGKIYTSEVNYTLETTNIATGMYIVHVTSDSGIKRVAKLVVTK